MVVIIVRGTDMETRGFEYLCWYFRLPTITRTVGVSDKYGKGRVRKIDFCGECTVVWVGYQTITKAFSYK